MKGKDAISGDALAQELRREIAERLRYAHSWLSSNSKKTLEATSFLYAVIERLEEKEQIAIDEQDEHKEIVAKRLLQQFRDSGKSELFKNPEYDKNNFQQGAEVDCASHIHLCKAACGRVPAAMHIRDTRRLA